MVFFLYSLILIFSVGSLYQGYFVLRLGAGMTLSFSVDSSSLLFFVTLGLIAFCVLLWSYYYLSESAQFQQFFSLVFLFLGSMITLIFSTNLLTLFISWDVLGFSSFFLVIYYSTRHSISSGLLTSFLNRLGDCFFFILFGLHGFYVSPFSGYSFSLLILISITKSAQVPFSSWLPAAIAAPTPVSALVHSSTLVTAGLYLLYRFLPSGSTLLVNIGLITTLLAGLSASLEADIKNIIAYSTLSQLGVIVICLGLGNNSIMFGHMLSHAGFNALMFICVGVVIHISFCGQESRLSSSLHSSSSVVGVCLSISSLCLCGLIFTSGWYSKEGILLSCYGQSSSLLQLLIFYFALGLTSSYTYRLLSSCFSVGYGSLTSTSLVSANANINVPFILLLVLSLVQCFNFQCKLCPMGSFLSMLDSSVFYVWCFAGLLLGHLLSTSVRFSGPGLASLCYLVAGSARLADPFSLLTYTEVAGIQGLAIGTLIGVSSKHEWFGLTALKVVALTGAALILI